MRVRPGSACAAGRQALRSTRCRPHRRERPPKTRRHLSDHLSGWTRRRSQPKSRSGITKGTGTSSVCQVVLSSGAFHCVFEVGPHGHSVRRASGATGTRCSMSLKGLDLVIDLPAKRFRVAFRPGSSSPSSASSWVSRGCEVHPCIANQQSSFRTLPFRGRHSPPFRGSSLAGRSRSSFPARRVFRRSIQTPLGTWPHP